VPDVTSPLQGTVVRVLVAPGDQVQVGQELVVLESMKMEHPVEADADGVVEALAAMEGATVMPGDVLVSLRPDVAASSAPAPKPEPDLGTNRPRYRPNRSQNAAEGGPGPVEGGPDRVEDAVGARADLAEVLERHRIGMDEARPDAVARRRERGQRTARENVYDLVDEGSFVEYGPLVIAAQRRRRPTRR